MGCDRQIAKSANFGLLYGAGAEGLRKYAGSSGVIMSPEQAVEIRDNWLNTYSGIRDWQREMNFFHDPPREMNGLRLEFQYLICVDF